MAREDASALPSKPWTFRVENIPEATSARVLLQYFVEEDRPGIEIKSVCPAVDARNGTLTATISFTVPGGQSPRQPKLIDPDDSDLDIDDTFYGLTPLNDPQQPVVADVIAVTGLAGHAFGSWASSSRHMWLRDALPKDLPNVRVLIYGYNSQLQKAASRSIVGDHVRMFKQRLLTLPTSARVRHRPIIFIGHNLGSLLIKKTLVEIIGSPAASHICDFPIVIFLGAPHRGLDNSALQTILGVEDLSKDIVDELGESSPTLTDLNESFAKIAHQLDIMSCYESRPTPTLIKDTDGVWKREGPPAMMVTQNSAMLYSAKEIRVPCDTDHSRIAKLKRGEGGLYPTIKGHIQQALERFETEQALFAERSLYSETNASHSPRQLPHQDRPESSLMTGQRLLLPPPQDPSPSNSYNDMRSSAPSLESYKVPMTPHHHLHPRYDESDRTGFSIHLPLQHRSNETGMTSMSPGAISDHSSLSMSTPLVSPMIFPIETASSIADGRVRTFDEKQATDDATQRIHESPGKHFVQTVETPIEEMRRPSIPLTRVIDSTEKEVYLPPGETEARRPPLSTADKRVSSPDAVISRVSSSSPQPDADENAQRSSKRRSNQGRFFQMLRRKSSTDSSPAQIFLKAAAENNIDVIRELVTQGIDLETKISQLGNRTALHEAAKHNSYESATFLIGKGAKLDAKMKNRCTPLHEACFSGARDVAKLLIVEGAQLEAKNLEDETPLQLAVKRGHIEIVKSLVENGAEVNGVRTDRKNTLQIAYLREIPDIIQTLKAAGARLPFQDHTTPQWPRAL